jgi:hypothetical protein
MHPSIFEYDLRCAGEVVDMAVKSDMSETIRTKALELRRSDSKG